VGHGDVEAPLLGPPPFIWVFSCAESAWAADSVQLIRNPLILTSLLKWADYSRFWFGSGSSRGLAGTAHEIAQDLARLGIRSRLAHNLECHI